ncbi:MAG: Rrf2 family transcriptional regulator [Filomicrobium sp.]
MHLNKTTTHAIRLLVACAQAEADMVKVADLATTLDLTQQNTFKIVHLLSRAGLVSAMRGRNGGVALARAATDIRVGEVVAAMEYPEAKLSPSTADKTIHAQNVPLINEAVSAFLEVLNQNSIADLAAANSSKKPKRSDKTPAARKRASTLQAYQPSKAEKASSMSRGQLSK